MAKALYLSNSFCIVWYTLKGKNTEGYIYTYLTTTLFFVNNKYNKKKHSMPFNKYIITNYYLNYNEALYKLFKILIIKFIIKHGISPENTNISLKNTDISLINL